MWLTDPDSSPRTEAADRLAAADVMHRDERILRRGWAWVWGRAEVDGTTRRVRVPLLTEPVRMRRLPQGYRIESAGDLELTPLLADPDIAARLEDAAGENTSSWLNGPQAEEWIHRPPKGRVADLHSRPVRRHRPTTTVWWWRRPQSMPCVTCSAPG